MMERKKNNKSWCAAKYIQCGYLKWNQWFSLQPAAQSDGRPVWHFCPCPPSESKSSDVEKQRQPRGRWSGQRLTHNPSKVSLNQSDHYFSLFNKYAQQFVGIIGTSNNPVRTVGFLSLTELRTPHGALNIVATPPAANEFEEVETEGGIQKARRVQTTNDWWLRVHRWRICVFFKYHTSLLFTIKGSVRWAAAPPGWRVG